MTTKSWNIERIKKSKRYGYEMALMIAWLEDWGEPLTRERVVEEAKHMIHVIENRDFDEGEEDLQSYRSYKAFLKAYE